MAYLYPGLHSLMYVKSETCEQGQVKFQKLLAHMEIYVWRLLTFHWIQNSTCYWTNKKDVFLLPLCPLSAFFLLLGASVLSMCSPFSPCSYILLWSMLLFTQTNRLMAAFVRALLNGWFTPLKGGCLCRQRKRYANKSLENHARPSHPSLFLPVKEFTLSNNGSVDFDQFSY